MFRKFFLNVGDAGDEVIDWTAQKRDAQHVSTGELLEKSATEMGAEGPDPRVAQNPGEFAVLIGVKRLGNIERRVGLAIVLNEGRLKRRYLVT
jgi:hypothetical protein